MRFRIHIAPINIVKVVHLNNNPLHLESSGIKMDWILGIEYHSLS